VNAGRIIKVVATASFILVTVAIFLLRESPATGYESSIYTATPLMVWVCLLLSIAAGIGIVVYHVYKRGTNSRLWIIGLVLLLFSSTVFLSMHILRGYAFWNASGDPSTHLSWIKDIIVTGRETHSDNFYPAMHVYFAELSLIFNASPVLLAKWIPVGFAILMMIFVYFVAGILLKDRRTALLATAISTSLVTGWYLSLTPNHLANMIFPMALYFVFRKYSPGTMYWRLLYFIIIIFMVLFHPVPSFVLIIILMTLWIPAKVHGLISREDIVNNRDYFSFDLLSSALSLAIFFTWISSFYVWPQLIRNIHNIFTGVGSGYTSALLNRARYAEGLGYDLTCYFFKEYGGVLVIVLLAGAGLFFVLKMLPRGSKMFSVYGPIAIIFVVMIILYNTSIFNPIRLLIYIIILSIICAGFTLAVTIEKTRDRRRRFAASLIIALVLFGVSLNGISTLYLSPYIQAPNAQTTHGELDGLDWLFRQRDNSLDLAGISIAPQRMGDLLVGYHEVNRELVAVPPHFGYYENEQLGESFDSKSYLVLTERDEKLYTEIYPEIAEIRFLPQDFKKLELDPSVDKIYSGGGVDVYLLGVSVPPDDSS
jgi:hypothetical protein